MNDRILTDLFGISAGYHVTHTEYAGDFLRLHLKVQDDHFLCPQCASSEVSRKGRRHRELQTVPIGLTPVYLVTEVPACQCRACGHRFELSPLLPRPIATSPIAWWRSRRPSRKSCASPMSPG